MSQASPEMEHAKQNPKDAHLSALSDELAQFQREKEKLMATADRTGAREEDLRALDRSLEDARSALDEAEKSPAKKWVQAKAKADDAFQALRDTVHRLKSPS